MRMVFSKEFRDLYRSPEAAYASLDFKGKGFITKEDIMESMVIKRAKNLTLEDINNFLAYFNLFPLKGGHRQDITESGKALDRGVMIFDTFKKTFFSHLHQTFNISEVL